MITGTVVLRYRQIRWQHVKIFGHGNTLPLQTLTSNHVTPIHFNGPPSFSPFPPMSGAANLASSASSTTLGHRESRNPYTGRLPSQRNLRSEEHTSELQSRGHLVCRLLLD